MLPKGSDGGSSLDWKWGFIDVRGRVVIPAIYQKVGDFSQGLAPVQEKTDGLWGFIDQTGQMVIAPRFNTAGLFSNGLAEVSFDEKIVRLSENAVSQESVKIGYINRKGQVVWQELIGDVWLKKDPDD